MMEPEMLKKLILNNFCEYGCAFTIDIMASYAKIDSMHMKAIVASRFKYFYFHRNGFTTILWDIFIFVICTIKFYPSFIFLY